MQKLSTIEKIGFALVILVTLGGAIVAFIDPIAFENNFTQEDGLVENLTAIMLMLSGVLMLYRVIKLRSGKGTWFYITSIAICLAFIFVGGEEISWGQRIFNVESSEFFKENNAQAETNLHNLVVGDVKLNKLIFGKILTAGLLIYTIIFPILYKRWTFFKDLADRLYFPIPTFYQSAVFVGCSLIIAIIDAGRKWEVMEFGFSVVFFLVLLAPENEKIYSPQITK